MHSRFTQTRGLVFGGLMAALIVLFSLVPVLAALMPIPLVLAFVRYGGRVAVLTAVAATLFTMAFSGLVSGILIIPAGILPGLVFGLGFRRKWRPLTIGIAAVLAFFFGFALQYVVARVAVFGGRDPFLAALEQPQVRAVLDTLASTADFVARLAEQAAAKSGAAPSAAQEQIIEQYRMIAETLKRDPVGVAWTMLPSTVFLAGVFSSTVNYLLCRLTLPRFGHEVPAWTSFAEFRLPAWSVWLFAILSFLNPLLLRGDIVSLPWWGKLLLNVFQPLLMIFVLAGAAVAYGYLRKRGQSRGSAALLVSLGALLLGPLGLELLVLLAIWDTVFDLRGLGHGIWPREEG